MTVSEALIDWLEQYGMGCIDTDRQSDVVATYSLTKEPTDNIKTYLSGKVEHTQYYQLSARLDTQMDVDRIDNGRWLEGLERWVSNKNRLGELPSITGATVKSVEITSSFYCGMSQSNSSIYSLTVAIKYVI